MPLPLFDSGLVNTLHEAAFDYAVRVNQRLSERPESDRLLVARAAVFVITHDLVCLHSALKEICRTGWAFAASILQRSMLDGTCSLLAVTQSSSPDLSGFKYFHAHAVSTEVDEEFREEMERITMANVARHLSQMRPEDQTTANEFLQRKKPLIYWFQEEFESPMKLLRRFANSDIVAMYRYLSSAAHLGFVGTRMLRDKPDDHDINPRPKDYRSIGFAMVGSSRILAECIRVRAIFENISDPGYEVVMALIAKCEQTAQ